MRSLALVSLFLLLACGSAVTQGVDYNPPNDLPIGEPTDRSHEDAGDAGRDARADG